MYVNSIVDTKNVEPQICQWHDEGFRGSEPLNTLLCSISHLLYQQTTNNCCIHNRDGTVSSVGMQKSAATSAAI